MNYDLRNNKICTQIVQINHLQTIIIIKRKTRRGEKFISMLKKLYAKLTLYALNESLDYFLIIYKLYAIEKTNRK